MKLDEAWVALAVFVLGALGALARWAWQRYFARPRLLWSVEAVPLLRVRDVAGSLVDVRIAGASVADPATARVTVRNGGRRAIKTADFDGGKPCSLTLPGAVRLVMAGSAADLGVVEGGTEVTLPPQLLAGGGSLQADVLLEGYRPGEGASRFRSTLADVAVSRVDASEPVGVPSGRFASMVGFAVCAVAAAVATTIGLSLDLLTKEDQGQQERAVLTCTSGGSDGATETLTCVED